MKVSVANDRSAAREPQAPQGGFKQNFQPGVGHQPSQPGFGQPPNPAFGQQPNPAFGGQNFVKSRI